MRPAGRCAIALAVALLLALPAAGQNQRETERRLQQVKRELDAVASERRKLEGERGEATRSLRTADERVAAATRALQQTEAQLAREQAELAALAGRRDGLRERLGAQRDELAALLRAAYTVGDHAALKLLLSQDSAGGSGRLLAYHRHLQRDRGERIRALGRELAELDTLEREIGERTAALEAIRATQREQRAGLEADRKARAATVAGLEERYGDRRQREQALGRDARGLEQVLTQLRAAARRAAAERRRAEQAAARESSTTPGRANAPRRAPAQVARTAPVQVGGLGWPVAGTLLARFGARMPDGRASSGVLIGAAAGTPVKAVAEGTVVFAEWMTGYGNIVIVDHGNGHMSLYAHNDAVLRQVGDRVGRGDTVASVGNSGGQGQPALYFELRRDGKPIDPSTWLQRR
ncbi:peptidase M23 [Luteimonas yindakuii]|uniref:murein hydrolase activator EnvC family protein n=1 Tax=Luteimonas yindakuii TaxID=2565782 RepID=UPI0010A4BD25|nr:peptidoglycan DD-metalloendopeptidase family protein [Luteimonas yindakuii]QCO66778.1 peptidase M23 [Luteimonas yindakuii]